MRTITHVVSALLAASLCSACASERGKHGDATLSVLIAPEDTISDGIAAGDSEVDIRDGFDVHYDKFIVAVGDVRTRFVTDTDVQKQAAQIHVIDLAKLSPLGQPLFSLTHLRAGRWDFNYAVPLADTHSLRDESVSKADFARMQNERLSYLIHGTLAKADGRSCPPAALATPGDRQAHGENASGDPCYDQPQIAFSIAARAPTQYGPCQLDDQRGFSVPEQGTAVVTITIHGDHLFFNGFPESDESSVLRLAQWLADCDLNLDGRVDERELSEISPADLGEIDERFQLGGSPITPLASMLDYVRAQLETQGHFNGEGECPWSGYPPASSPASSSPASAPASVPASTSPSPSPSP